jgi:dihydrodipicolinate synthase/N-acetylneuraminate lyase
LLFVGPLWIAGIKYAMFLLGVGSGVPVSPLQPLTAEEEAKVDEFTRRSFPDLELLSD